ncbi:MAG: HypC/HybG/HupF family hydrogenase formation chaperone [Lachnospiraceae bacterium]|nr:HypC/HybG/HupF family hydrogenase formation chaperone [Lachnospiraceae bacterium]MBR4209075.1 HypC/HybG/HupF family hydrogenase formation chaperone [Lachnospiraceae bacterium]
MCLAVPLKVVEKNGSDAVAEVDGIKRKVRLDFVPEACPGDYVMVHAGFAIERLDPKQAEENLAAIREVADAVAGLE